MQTCLPELILVGFEGPNIFSFGDWKVQLFAIVDLPYVVLNACKELMSHLQVEMHSLQDRSIRKSILSKGMILF